MSEQDIRLTKEQFLDLWASLFPKQQYDLDKLYEQGRQTLEWLYDRLSVVAVTRESGEAASPFRCENCGRTIEEGESYTVWSDGIRTHTSPFCCERGSATKPKEKRDGKIS